MLSDPQPKPKPVRKNPLLYSSVAIAIALLEFLGDRGDEHKIQIFATDVDDDALARARSAVYSPDILRLTSCAISTRGVSRSARATWQHCRCLNASG